MNSRKGEIMNKYLAHLSKNRSASFFGEDDLETELIIGALNDIMDEVEILSFTTSTMEDQQVKMLQDDIKRRLSEIKEQSKKIKCPFRRKNIQEKINQIKGHGSLNVEMSPFAKIAYTSLVAGSGVLLTAMGYQAYLTRDIDSPTEVAENQFLGKLYDDPVSGAPFFARPKLTHILKEHSLFYAVEFALIATLYKKTIEGK